MSAPSGHLQFCGKDDPFAHGMKSGRGSSPASMVQWQNGKQVCVWPAALATGKMMFPAFIKQVEAH